MIDTQTCMFPLAAMGHRSGYSVHKDSEMAEIQDANQEPRIECR